MHLFFFSPSQYRLLQICVRPATVWNVVVFICLCVLCSCDWNMYTIRYAVALSKQRGVKRTAGDALCDEDSEVMSEASLEETDMLM